MKTERIKGTCENCGFQHKGEVRSPFPAIACPNCGQQTDNFDSEYVINEGIKDPEMGYGKEEDYKESTYRELTEKEAS